MTIKKLIYKNQTYINQRFINKKIANIFEKPQTVKDTKGKMTGY